MKFAWSFSRLKNFETCARRFYEVDLAKNFKDESEQLKWGTEVHEAFARSLKKSNHLPSTMSQWQKYVDGVLSKVTPTASLLVEQRYALTRALQPCEFFSPSAWFRTVIDAVVIDGDVAVAWDWKTGKLPHEGVPTVQLMLSAQCLFAYHPELRRVGTTFVFLNESVNALMGATYTRQDAAQEWLDILPRVGHMERAFNAHDYPPKPNSLCARFCPVVTCEHHGKRHR